MLTKRLATMWCALALTATMGAQIVSGNPEDYFTVVMFTDPHVGPDKDGNPDTDNCTAEEMAGYVREMIRLGKEGGKKVDFGSAAPRGFNATCDLVLCLGDMDPYKPQGKGEDFTSSTSHLFDEAGIPFVTILGNHDMHPDYFTGENGGAGVTAGFNDGGAYYDGLSLGVVNSVLEKAQKNGIENLHRFTDSRYGSDCTQVEPFTFTFRGVRFYMGQTYWFQKIYRMSLSATYYAPDGVVAALEDFVNDHKDEPSLWAQHYPFSFGDGCDRWWLDQNDVGRSIAPSNSSVYPYSQIRDDKDAAGIRKKKLEQIITRTRNPWHFSGHVHEYGTRTYNGATVAGVTDYTVASLARHPGAVMFALCKKGEGVVAVKAAALGELPAYTGEDDDPAPGDVQQYYLFNVYQGKFLMASNQLVTARQATPTLWTMTGTGNNFAVTAGGSLLCGQEEWTVSPSECGYIFTCPQGALMFGAGSACKVGDINAGYNKDCAQWRLVTRDEYKAMLARKTFTTCALNVDGMPRSVKVAGMYEVKLNPDAKEGPGATAIGARMRELGYDVIGLSEDFNYHDEIMAAVNDGGKLYSDATHRGVISAGLGAVGDYMAKRTIFDTDGLGLLTRDARATFSNESWTRWGEHYGYDDSGADGLINKGYRYYTITLEDGTQVDLYILHMDAETNPGDNAARESQMVQLADAIIATHIGRPIIVMGDTNCRYTRDPLHKKFVNLINADERFTCKDVWVELCLGGAYPLQNGQTLTVDDKGYRLGEVVDKVFYINNTEAPIRLQAETFRQDLSFINDEGEPLADHWPMVTAFSYHDYDPAIDDVIEESVTMENVYLRNRATGWLLTQGGHWGTHAVQGTCGTPMTINQAATGRCLLTSTVGALGSIGYIDRPFEEGSVWTMMKHGNGSYVFSYSDNGVRRALSGNDPYTYDWGSQEYHQPNIRYVTTSAELDMNDPYQQWDILTGAELLAEARHATPDHPSDLTFLLPGANFNRLDSQNASWRETRSSTDRSWGNFGGDGYQANDVMGNYVGEMYVDQCRDSHSGLLNKTCRHYATWDVYQEIDVPNGTYRVTCQAFCRPEQATATATVKFYAGSKEVDVPSIYSVKQDNIKTGTSVDGYMYPNSMSEAARFFYAGHYGLTLGEVTVTDGKLRVGIKKTSNSSKDATCWTCFDNFQLQYLGSGKTQYELLHEDVEALAGSGSLAIAAALSDFPLGDEEEALAAGCDIQRATAVLANAITMAGNADRATSLLSNADFAQGFNTGWTWENTVEDNSVTDHKIVDGNTFHMYAPGNKASHLYQSLTDIPNGVYKVSADFKTWAPSVLKKNGCPDGYSWTALCATPRGGNTGRSDNVAGDVPSVGSTAGTFAGYSVYATVVDNALTIGVRSDHSHFYMLKNIQVEKVDDEASMSRVAQGLIFQHLSGIDHQALEYSLEGEAAFDGAVDVDLRAGGFVQQPNALIRVSKAGQVAGSNVIASGVCPSLVVTDGAPFSNSTPFTATRATYTRSMPGNTWGTLLLPFDIQGSEEVQLYSLKDVTLGTGESTGVMQLEPVGSLAAGTPSILRRTGDGGAISIEAQDVTVAACQGSVTSPTAVEGWSLNGAFDTMYPEAADHGGGLYYINGDKFWQARGTVEVTPFRACFTAPRSSKARAFKLVTGDVPVDVDTPSPAAQPHDIYTISGVRLPGVQGLRPGVYITGTRKIVVKQ